MDPRKVFGIAGAVMVVSLLGLYLTGFPLILAPVLSIGITFAVAAWVQMQKYYPGQNAKCAYGTILTLLPTLVALWVVQQAGGLASQLATKRLDSDIRTEIAAMLRQQHLDPAGIRRCERPGQLGQGGPQRGGNHAELRPGHRPV